MYAVFRSGGKQYRAAQGDVLRLEKIEADEGASLEFDEVLLLGDGNDIKVGSPLVSGGTVTAKVVRQGKSGKVPVVKFKRRQNYLRQGTHRQFFTEVEITGISGSGKSKTASSESGEKASAAAEKKVAKKPAAKKAAEKKPAAKKSATKKSASKKAAAKKTTKKKGS
jgi:large subunit ribosomal protein L21